MASASSAGGATANRLNRPVELSLGGRREAARSASLLLDMVRRLSTTPAKRVGLHVLLSEGLRTLSHLKILIYSYEFLNSKALLTFEKIRIHLKKLFLKYRNRS